MPTTRTATSTDPEEDPLKQLVWLLSEFEWTEEELKYATGKKGEDFQKWVVELKSLVRMEGWEVE